MKHVLENVREYAEGLDVFVQREKGRLVVKASNQGGLDCTLVDLIDLLEWVKKNDPALWNSTGMPDKEK